MRNQEYWEPTNVIETDKGWAPNYSHIAPWSHYVAGLEADAYYQVMVKHVSGDLLEIGAGTVPYYGIYKDSIKSVTTTDWHNSSHSNSYIDVISDSNDGLSFKDEIFDTVLMADVLEHINRPEVLFKDVGRVLKERGKVIVFVPFMYGIHESPHDYFRYTEFSLEKLCLQNNFEILDLSPYGGGPDVVVDLMEKMLYEKKVLSSIGKIATKAIVNTQAYKKFRDKFQDRFPIGYSLVGQKN
jgi:SAM-dependent methyltransferase